MFAQLVFSREFFQELYRVDGEIAARVAAERCGRCGGPVHRGDYERKPRGGLVAEAGEAFTRRFSFCCGREGCRRRTTPPSLLAAPPGEGDLRPRLEELAARPWKHPTTGEAVRFAFKTLERWYYDSYKEADPLRALERKVPSHAGTHPAVSAALREAIGRQHKDHPRWSYQLHYDNLVALGREDPRLGPMPAYATVCRYMKHHGLLRHRRKKRRDDEGLVPRETRSYEVEHVHGLWHLDFHMSSRGVATPQGEMKKPQLLGILDDRSRLCCHLQWYLEEDTESLVHGLSQAIQINGTVARSCRSSSSVCPS